MLHYHDLDSESPFGTDLVGVLESKILEFCIFRRSKVASLLRLECDGPKVGCRISYYHRLYSFFIIINHKNIYPVVFFPMFLQYLVLFSIYIFSFLICKTRRVFIDEI